MMRLADSHGSRGLFVAAVSLVCVLWIGLAAVTCRPAWAQEEHPDHLTLLQTLGEEAAFEFLGQLDFPPGADVYLIPEIDHPANWFVASILARTLREQGYGVIRPALAEPESTPGDRTVGIAAGATTGGEPGSGPGPASGSAPGDASAPGGLGEAEAGQQADPGADPGAEPGAERGIESGDEAGDEGGDQAGDETGAEAGDEPGDESPFAGEEDEEEAGDDEVGEGDGEEAGEDAGEEELQDEDTDVEPIQPRRRRGPAAQQPAQPAASPQTATEYAMKLPARGEVCTFRVLECGVSYPWVKRTWLIGPHQYGRYASIKLRGSRISQPGVRVSSVAASDRIRIDDFPGWARPYLEGDGFPFPIEQPQGAQLRRLVEPVVVVSIVAGLVYLFNENQK